jgi:hypothetical protein
MNKEQTRVFLAFIGAKVPQTQTRPGRIVSSCPLAPWTHDQGTDKKPAFAAVIEPGDAHTDCFACDWHGSMTDLVLDMRYRSKKAAHVNVHWGQALQLILDAEAAVSVGFDHPTEEDTLFHSPKGVHVFPTWWLYSFPGWRHVPFAVDYLKERNVPPELADVLDIKADTAQRRVCFPIRDFEGQLVGLHGRAVDASTEPRYRMYTHAEKNNPIVWFGESWVDRDRPILVVEGPFDVLSCARVYDNVVSPLFATPSKEKLKRMGDALEWFTLFDRGKGGDAGRKKIGQLIGQDHVITHLKPPLHRKDPGEMTEQELVALLGKYSLTIT